MGYNIKVNPDKLDDFANFVNSFLPAISALCDDLTTEVSSLASATDAESMAEIQSIVAQIKSVLEDVMPSLSQLYSSINKYAREVRIARGVITNGAVATIGGGATTPGTGSGAGASTNAGAVYQAANGMTVTTLNSSASNSGNRKYTDGVVFKGNMTYSTGKNTKNTVAINRKVHQYAAGIDLNYVRPDGTTNYQAMLKGKAPIVEVKVGNGVVRTRLDLHHLTQQETINFPNSAYQQGTLLEIPCITHKQYHNIIHMRYIDPKGVRRSFRVVKTPNHKYVRSNDDGQYNAFKSLYWKTRAMMLMQQTNP